MLTFISIFVIHSRNSMCVCEILCRRVETRGMWVDKEGVRLQYKYNSKIETCIWMEISWFYFPIEVNFVFQIPSHTHTWAFMHVSYCSYLIFNVKPILLNTESNKNENTTMTTKRVHKYIHFDVMARICSCILWLCMIFVCFSCFFSTK
jgi:hypothetical protein